MATVSKSGVITAHKYGTAKISITADGNRFTFEVNVAPQRAIDACKTGYGIMYSSSYSQARRMTTGYYDCSSLVFRSYGCDTRLLGGISSWAPTAAAMASYMERTGKVISYRGVNVSKLRRATCCSSRRHIRTDDTKIFTMFRCTMAVATDWKNPCVPISWKEIS